MIARFVGDRPVVSHGDRRVQPGETVGPGGDVEVPLGTVELLLRRADFVRVEASFDVEEAGDEGGDSLGSEED